MKTKTFLAAVLAAGLVAGPLAAADAPLQREVTVTGQGQMEIAPDQAVISLGVTHHAEEASLAMRQVSSDMVDVISALRDLGIEGGDLQTSQVSLNPIWSKSGSYDSGGDRRITGFSASNTLMLRVRDLDRLGEVLDHVLQAGANRFQGLRFSISDQSALDEQLRNRAMEDAFKKAGDLAAAAGLELGPVRVITDHGSGGGHPAMAMEMMRSSAMPIEAGELEFSYSVQVVFDLIEPE